MPTGSSYSSVVSLDDGRIFSHPTAWPSDTLLQRSIKKTAVLTVDATKTPSLILYLKKRFPTEMCQRRLLKRTDVTWPRKVHIVQTIVLPVGVYRCECWTIKKAECQRIDAFELWYWRRLLESPLDYKEIKQVNFKGNQSWLFTGRTDAEAETPILWLPEVKSQLIRKDADARKDWRQEEKGKMENKMAGWHHQLNGHEFEQALGDGEGQHSLACCHPQGHKELDMTEWTTQVSFTSSLDVFWELWHLMNSLIHSFNRNFYWASTIWQALDIHKYEIRHSFCPQMVLMEDSWKRYSVWNKFNHILLIKWSFKMTQKCWE